MTLEVLILLLAFQAKHLIADYYLQFPYMYMNKGSKDNWIRPLFDHTAVHGLGTMIILVLYMLNNYVYIEENGSLMAILIISMIVSFDMITHFITDRWKATRKSKPDESQFWHNLGIDQGVHHIVGVLIIFSIQRFI